MYYREKHDKRDTGMKRILIYDYGRKLQTLRENLKMKRLFTIFAGLAVAIAMSGVASAQRGHGGGRPANTGLDHAETKANSHGQRGIENAENKQAEHKKDKHNKHKKHHKPHHDGR